MKSINQSINVTRTNWQIYSLITESNFKTWLVYIHRKVTFWDFCWIRWSWSSWISQLDGIVNLDHLNTTCNLLTESYTSHLLFKVERYNVQQVIVVFHSQVDKHKHLIVCLSWLTAWPSNPKHQYLMTYEHTQHV